MSYAIFADAATFETTHAQARTALNLPRVGRRNGILAPDRQQTVAVADFREKRVSPDGTVVAAIEPRLWPADVVSSLTLLTRAEVADYLPEEITLA